MFLVLSSFLPVLFVYPFLVAKEAKGNIGFEGFLSSFQGSKYDKAFLAKNLEDFFVWNHKLYVLKSAFCLDRLPKFRILYSL